MSHISISRQHNKSMKEARAAINKIAKAIAQKFSVEHEWNDETLHFSRSGVDGYIALSKGAVNINVRLGFLLMAIRQPIQSEIERILAEEFG